MPRDSGRRKEDGGSDHLVRRASHPDTLRSEISHRFRKFQSQYFHLAEMVVFLIVRFFLSHFLSGTLTILKIFKLLWFLADRLSPSCFFFFPPPHKSL